MDIRDLFRNNRLEFKLRQNSLVKYTGYSRQFISMLFKNRDTKLLKKQKILLKYAFDKVLEDKINDCYDEIEKIRDYIKRLNDLKNKIRDDD